MKIYLKFKKDFKDGEIVTADILNILKQGIPSPYPDNYLCEIKDIILEEPVVINNTPRYEIDIKLEAVKDREGKIEKASHPDKTKNGVFDLYNFIPVSAPRLKTTKAIESDERFTSKVEEDLRLEFSKKTDPLVIEYIRKQLLGYSMDDLILIKEKIEFESNKIKEKKEKLIKGEKHE